ncbi:MAG: SCO family protein [Deinococcus sp.]|nr:SCO family protein [Deinococcus sp.]
MKVNPVLLGLVITAGLALAVAGTGLFTRPYVFHGSLIDPPVPAVDFALTDQFGQPFHLSQQTGNVVLLFFGYTSCPDECPATLAQLKQVRAQLGNQAERVRVVFITVDPEQDTQEHIGEFLARFDPAFTGLTGSTAELEPVWRSYGVYQAKRTELVEHTSRIYAIDPRGNLRLTYPIETSDNDLARDIQQLLKGS